MLSPAQLVRFFAWTERNRALLAVSVQQVIGLPSPPPPPQQQQQQQQMQQMQMMQQQLLQQQLLQRLGHSNSSSR